MGKLATVTFINVNAEKTFKNGKTFKGAELSFKMEESGQIKKEFIFSNAPYMVNVKPLEKGDTIDVSYTKNGEYFNLSNITLVKKGGGTANAESTPKSESKRSYGGGGEDTEKQASIQRQNALTNAVSFTSTLLQAGAFKKTTTSDILLSETLRFAKEFAAFNAGTLQMEELKVDLAGVKKTKGGDEAPPFDVDDDFAFATEEE